MYPSKFTQGSTSQDTVFKLQVPCACLQVDMACMKGARFSCRADMCGGAGLGALTHLHIVTCCSQVW
eukprot:6475144-Amphidinium_carterae.2